LSIDIDELLFGEDERVPEFIDKAEEQLFAEAAIGVDVIEFLNSPLGRRLREYAAYEVDKATRELKTIDWWDKEAIRKLQFKAAVADQFLRFLRDAYVYGETAQKGLESYRN